ncbi:hypothetical protein [Peteryoungia ipomoeae]|uniref:Uncharacterized protein n=1 Tax=Peteryoungia ipomoeae TaxID=1210932 RepID=A0A4S8P262_9HYPH|nr:hypothetical protein [Peteryoungia ipomoeae]THV24140.1 hypothetical protein FAA97_09250 [Peteryoungia ipomoeae]
MEKSIARVAEVVGQFLGIARGDLEPADAYVTRLAVAINALPEAERLKLQAFVARTYAKLQLNVLIAAMSNSSGKEAITVAIALEISQEAQGDRQTQTIISSYRQAGGDPAREQSAYRPPVLPVTTASSPPASVSASTNQLPGTAGSALPPRSPEDRTRAAGAEKTTASTAISVVGDVDIEPSGSQTKAPSRLVTISTERATQPASRGDSEQTSMEGRISPPAIRDSASSPNWKDRLAAFLGARQAIEPQDAQIKGSGIGLERDAAAASRENTPKAQSERAGNGVYSVAPLPPALAPPFATPDQNQSDLISSLFRLAQQTDAQTREADATTGREAETKMPQNPEPATNRGQDAKETDTPRPGVARLELADAKGQDANASPLLSTLTGDAPATVPIAREAVPFAMFHYLAHDEPEDQNGLHEDEEGHDEREDEGEDDLSGEEAEGDATDEQTSQNDELLSPEHGEQGESDLLEQPSEPTEKYPKPRAQRLQEAQQVGPSHRELSAADPMHQMYLRMSGGI